MNQHHCLGKDFFCDIVQIFLWDIYCSHCCLAVMRYLMLVLADQIQPSFRSITFFTVFIHQKLGLIFYASSAWPNRPIGGHREGLGQSIQVKQHCEALWRFSQPHRDDPSALRRRRKARRPSRQTANKYRLREGGRLCGSSMCWTAGTVVPRGRPPSALRARPS